MYDQTSPTEDAPSSRFEAEMLCTRTTVTKPGLPPAPLLHCSLLCGDVRAYVVKAYVVAIKDVVANMLSRLFGHEDTSVYMAVDHYWYICALVSSLGLAAGDPGESNVHS